MECRVPGPGRHASAEQERVERADDEEAVEKRHQDERGASPHRRPDVLGQDARVQVEQVKGADDQHQPRHVGADLEQEERLREAQRDDAPQHDEPPSTP